MATSTLLAFQLSPEASTSVGSSAGKEAMRSVPPKGGASRPPACSWYLPRGGMEGGNEGGDPETETNLQRNCGLRQQDGARRPPDVTQLAMPRHVVSPTQ